PKTVSFSLSFPSSVSGSELCFYTKHLRWLSLAHSHSLWAEKKNRNQSCGSKKVVCCCCCCFLFHLSPARSSHFPFSLPSIRRIAVCFPFLRSKLSELII